MCCYPWHTEEGQFGDGGLEEDEDDDDDEEEEDGGLELYEYGDAALRNALSTICRRIGGYHAEQIRFLRQLAWARWSKHSMQLDPTGPIPLVVVAALRENEVMRWLN